METKMGFTTNDKQARPFEIITAFRIDSEFQFVVNTKCILEKIDIMQINIEFPIDYRYFENFKLIFNLPGFYLFDTFQ